MEIKIYSEDPMVQSCYSKTIKRMEYQTGKDGKDKVLERIMTNYYWEQYKRPYVKDKYYDYIRPNITEDAAYAAIQQAQIDYGMYLKAEESAKEDAMSEEDKKKALQLEWKCRVKPVWSIIISGGYDIRAFNDYPILYKGKYRKMGDLDAWGMNPADRPYIIEWCFLKLWEALLYYLKEPNPNKTSFYIDADLNVVRIDKIYIPAEIIDNYSKPEYYKRFKVTDEVEVPNFDDPLALQPENF